MMTAEGNRPLYLWPYRDAQEHYYAALKAAQQKLDWQAAADFLADAIVGSADELLATRSAFMELIEIWRQRRKFRQGSAALRTLDQLAHYPVLTIKRLADLLGVSFTAASQAVDQLVEAGILVERTGYERNRIFAAPEALTISTDLSVRHLCYPDNTSSTRRRRRRLVGRVERQRNSQNERAADQMVDYSGARLTPAYRRIRHRRQYEAVRRQLNTAPAGRRRAWGRSP